MNLCEILTFLVFLIVISNILGKLINALSVPLIQIILGFLATLAFKSIKSIEIEPKLFLALFIAPILFYEAKSINKREFWKDRKSIVTMAVGLVFITVLLLSFLIKVLQPSMPLSIAFCLASLLTPTDAVSVASLKKRISIPKRLYLILNGESLINDASGIVAFQFSLAAIITGTFSATKLCVSFLWVAFVGIIIGAIVALIKIKFFGKLSELGFDNNIVFILAEVLVPYFVYISCEKLGASGILGVVTAGLMHVFERGSRINPTNINRELSINDIWQAITYTLNGSVFLLTGIYLPKIFQNAINSNVTNFTTDLLLALSITMILYIIRFIYAFFFLPKTINSGIKTKFTNSLIIALSGIKGAITLGVALSIPFFINSNNEFPYRYSILFVSGLVIILTLIIGNFALPLIAKTDTKYQKIAHIHFLTVEIKIVAGVIKELNKELDENLKNMSKVEKIASKSIVTEYLIRFNKLQNYLNITKFKNTALSLKIYDWQKEKILQLLQDEKISYDSGSRYIKEAQENIKNIILKKHKNISRPILEFRKNERAFWKEFNKFKPKKNYNIIKKQKTKKSRAIVWRNIQLEVSKFIYSELVKLNKKLSNNKKYSHNENINFNDLNLLINEYKLLISTLRTLTKETEAYGKYNILDNKVNRRGILSTNDLAEFDNQYNHDAILSFRFERRAIQEEYEGGNITTDQLNNLRANVNLMESGLKTN